MGRKCMENDSLIIYCYKQPSFCGFTRQGKCDNFGWKQGMGGFCPHFPFPCAVQPAAIEKKNQK